METEILDSNEVKKAAEFIKKGELVAFPTETVYGLGANALDKEAVKKIFEVKGRPPKNPLIVHIASKRQLFEIAQIREDKKELISKVIEEFWPGPLTIVLKKKENVPEEVTAGLDTVAIRIPNNEIALELIEKSGPIAAPSANISGKPSGTCFEHVLEDFKGKISGIIKSKACDIGLESTVIDLTSEKPLLLRPGGTDFEEIKKVIDNLEIHNKKLKEAKSPGMRYKHYSPDAKIILFEKNAEDKIESYKGNFEEKGKKIKLLRSSKTNSFAKNLFKEFRDADKEKIEFILVTSVDEKGIGLPIMNRLRNAASEVVT